MRLVCRAITISTLALTLAGGIAVAQDHGDQDHRDQSHDQSHYVKHDDWKKGRKIRNEDWGRGEQVADWRAHHLRQPPKGYEWRLIDGQYVCARNDGSIFEVTVAR